jgi:hypothetical protein
MVRKLVTALSLVIGFSLIFSAQLSYAGNNSHHNNYPTPTTSPITTPVTGPVTSPVSLFTISGKVTDHIFGIFKKSKDRFMPEAGVKVKAKDIFNGHSASATTDGNGNYVINVGKKGFYKVTVVDGDAKYYLPPLHFVHLTDNKPTKSNIDFTGQIFKF